MDAQSLVKPEIDDNDDDVCFTLIIKAVHSDLVFSLCGT